MRHRRARLILVLLLLTALTLITIDFRSGSSGPLRTIGSDVFGPIENGVSSIFRPIGSWFSGLVHLNSYKSDNQMLRNEVHTLKTRIAQIQDDETNYQQLAKEDGLAHEAGFKVVHAHVTALSAGGLGLRWTIAIDAGSLDGLKVDQTVFDADGLVGRLIRVSRTSSTVLLACDSSFTTSAYVESTREQAIVQGNDLGPMQVEFVKGVEAKVSVGQRLVTSGDDLFAPQIPIGTVSSVVPGTNSFGAKVATVTPFVSFTRLGGDLVSVVVAQTRTVPRGALLPPKPSPTASPTPTVTVTVTAPPSGKHAKSNTSTTPAPTP